MAKVTVTRGDDSTFEVVVEGTVTTWHTVTVGPSYAAKLAGEVPVETLVRRSFDFLLEREPNTSILRQFDLSLIGRYFPEYERVIRGMLS